MTDNGPYFGKDAPRYNAGMRGQKGTVYEGGIRVPCFVRWPAHLTSGHEVTQTAANIDILPTLCEACGVEVPGKAHVDGKSLLPLMRGEIVPWPNRLLVSQWHRGDHPEPFRNSAVFWGQYKLVDGKELYDLPADPAEQHDIAAAHADIVADLRARYEAWFKDVSSSHGYEPPPIFIGAPQEDPVMLTRQDRRGAENAPEGNEGYWRVKVVRSGQYAISMMFPGLKCGGEAIVRLNGVTLRQSVESGATQAAFPATALHPGEGRLEALVTQDHETQGAHYVFVKRVP